VILGRSTPSEIEVQWSEPNGYAMMFISAAKPSERSAHQKDSDADTPDRKHSHYRDRHGIDLDHTEGLQRIPQWPPNDEIQHARKQKEGEKRGRQHTKKFRQ
jgi:hypothetical protein